MPLHSAAVWHRQRPRQGRFLWVEDPPRAPEVGWQELCPSGHWMPIQWLVEEGSPLTPRCRLGGETDRIRQLIAGRLLRRWGIHSRHATSGQFPSLQVAWHRLVRHCSREGWSRPHQSGDSAGLLAGIGQQLLFLVAFLQHRQWHWIQ